MQALLAEDYLQTQRQCTEKAGEMFFQSSRKIRKDSEGRQMYTIKVEQTELRKSFLHQILAGGKNRFILRIPSAKDFA